MALDRTEEFDRKMVDAVSRGSSTAAAGKLRDAMTEHELSEYLADLRLRYRRLPALQDELNQVFGE